MQYDKFQKYVHCTARIANTILSAIFYDFLLAQWEVIVGEIVFFCFLFQSMEILTVPVRKVVI